MQISTAGGGRSYANFKAVVAAFDPSDIRAVFYDLDGPGFTTVSACLVIFWSGEIYINGNWAANPELTATFLTDFPSAILGAVTGAY